MASEPFPKEIQLRRGERRYMRKVASPRIWQSIISEKKGPCRVCGSNGQVEFHHLVPRAIGGHDVRANIVPLCSGCHRAVTGYDKAACAKLRESLTDDEYAYAVDVLGEARFETRFPVLYEDAAKSPTRRPAPFAGHDRKERT